jgi:hypothetical protein
VTYAREMAEKVTRAMFSSADPNGVEAAINEVIERCAELVDCDGHPADCCCPMHDVAARIRALTTPAPDTKASR